MQLTKYTHSCIRFDDGGRALVIDPGVFSEVEQALDGVDTVLITHEHPDHLDVERVTAAARRNSRLRIWAPASVGALLDGLRDRVVAVSAGETFEAGGFEVRTFGGQHAVIHPTIPVVPNVGFLIGGVYHPGDSLIVPPAEVKAVFVPIGAPWANAAQLVDFAVSVRAAKTFPAHEATTNPAGAGIVEGHIARVGGQFGSEFVHLDTGTVVNV